MLRCVFYSRSRVETYGFQKAADDISLTQLQKLTGLSRQGVVNGIAGLGNLLGVENGDDGMNRYRLNVDLSSGELVNLFDQSKKLTSQKHGLKASQRSRHTKLNKNKTNKTTEPNGSSVPFHWEKRKLRGPTRPRLMPSSVSIEPSRDTWPTGSAQGVAQAQPRRRAYRCHHGGGRTLRGGSPRHRG